MGGAQASPVGGLLCKTFSDDDFFLSKRLFFVQTQPELAKLVEEEKLRLKEKA